MLISNLTLQCVMVRIFVEDNDENDENDENDNYNEYTKNNKENLEKSIISYIVQYIPFTQRNHDKINTKKMIPIIKK